KTIKLPLGWYMSDTVSVEIDRRVRAIPAIDGTLGWSLNRMFNKNIGPRWSSTLNQPIAPRGRRHKKSLLDSPSKFLIYQGTRTLRPLLERRSGMRPRVTNE